MSRRLRGPSLAWTQVAEIGLNQPFGRGEGSSAWLQNDQEGVSLGAFNEQEYLQSVLGTDFSLLDATQSAKTLLRLREQFLQHGLR